MKINQSKNNPELSIEWYQKINNPSLKVFRFEKEIFGNKYSSCPTTYQDFLKFFNCAYLQVTLSINNEIVGLLITDELIKGTLYYLRIIGVKPKFRNMRIGSKLFLNFVESIPSSSYVAFVSNNATLHRIVNSAKGLQMPKVIPDDIHRQLSLYNKRLCGVKPMQKIERYYKLQPSGYSDASFHFFIKGK